MTKDASDRVARIQAEWRRERPDLDVAPQAVIGRLHRLAAHLTGELASVYRAHDLGEGEFDVLAALRRAGSPYERAPRELADHTMVTTGAMTKRLDRLAAAGLIVRRHVAGDGRRRVVALTPRGLDVIDAAFADHMDNERRLVDQLSDDDRDRLEAILTRWLRAYESPLPS
ncbi:MarR family winged helix-turn-helix transcriptional regulator [Cryobacterium glucosi]|uniref:MarR family transcriptional regulator n=1 Tax=Cryobacterium glucosi TaxID=1259175 RepID=A0ABY2IR71_9MICO|nr:MarR family transcriptional regulator [Cryobacterium glucosi]TFC21811.1 MarR family transcriptional regulator [Cryobacterium glucosi]